MNDIYQMSVEDNILFAKRCLVDSIYREAKLEGIGVTFPQTNEIVEGRSVAGLSIDDVVKINNLKHAWKFVFDTLNYPIDLRYVRQINYEVGQRIVNNAGDLRVSDVSIGGTDWKPKIPDFDKESKKISEIINISSISDTERAVDMMLHIMRAQMFYDGNKRTAQLVANQMLISKGCGIFSVPESDISTFLKELVSFYETNDSASIKAFIENNCLLGIDETKRKLTNLEKIDDTTRQFFYAHQRKSKKL